MIFLFFIAQLHVVVSLWYFCVDVVMYLRSIIPKWLVSFLLLRRKYGSGKICCPFSLAII